MKLFVQTHHPPLRVHTYPQQPKINTFLERELCQGLLLRLREGKFRIHSYNESRIKVIQKNDTIHGEILLKTVIQNSNWIFLDPKCCVCLFVLFCSTFKKYPPVTSLHSPDRQKEKGREMDGRREGEVVRPPLTRLCASSVPAPSQLSKLTDFSQIRYTKALAHRVQRISEEWMNTLSWIYGQPTI